ncbi:uncharacterized protein LOC122032392 isoform X1 [Zingiber officinale]|uniref:uncharacterized protein LOC122032392 isoform X1 n=1 Tax=Zingiber officinale TaxID=94328 RepID=UPI001C4C904D|nr:uncharacterized protein LOC122032392 isoform X1 [Zingiber officinale]
MAGEAEGLLFLVCRQIEEIKTLTDRAAAYAALLQALHRGASDHPPSLEALADSFPYLLPLLLSDIHHFDEETAAYSLKCLGFMLYHPSLVTRISEDGAILALESLAKLITITRMKHICNLGVWCFAVQQIGPSAVKFCLHLILEAIIHALDNPFGSLSITYEATQALMALSKFSVEMRSMSNIWVLPLCRRLISNNKRERDIAERCLLRTKSIICPSPIILSMAVMSDVKRKLLPTMMDMMEVTQDQRQKIAIIQTWGWYISLLGSDALKDRHLVNKMLKIPEQTFVDPDIQVQMATLVAWESLIDALLPSQFTEIWINIIQNEIKQTRPATAAAPDVKIDGLLRRIKVLMTPIHGILSSKCDLSVQLRCLLTWRYLLRKLDLSVNYPSVISTTFWQTLKVVFLKGPNDENRHVWNTCIDLLDEFLLSKLTVGKTILNGEKLSLFPAEQTDQSGAVDRPIKWLPWDIKDVSEQLNVVFSIILPEKFEIMTSECRSLTLDAGLKIYRSVLKGVQAEIKRIPQCHEKVNIYITTISMFIKEVRETLASNHSAHQYRDFSLVHVQFTEATRDELEHSLLSPFNIEQIGSEVLC